jgi:hypothetical protein
MAETQTRSTPSAAPGAVRQERDALLLELGALVYELHRQGRRAPELLQAKATSLDDVDAHMPGPEALGLPCPHCFSAAVPGQLVCLECGEPLNLRRPPEQRRRVSPLLVLAAIVGLLGAAASGFALAELTSHDGSAGARPKAEPASARRDQADAERPSGGVAASTQSGAEDEAVALAPWPADAEGYTVVLVTSSDEAGARRVAWEAARSGVEAGLLRSDDYAELGEGLWLVFAGRHEGSAEAERAAAKLGERYPGAYVQQVVPAG